MTLPVYANPISIGQIQTEFGGTNPAAISEYYAGGLYTASGAVGFPLGVQTAIPTSGVISLGIFHSSALTSEGRVFTWGYNYYGQLGDGTILNTNIPIDLTGDLNLGLDEKVVDVELGEYHSMAITSNRRIFTWGRNQYGQLGNGNTVDSMSPIELPLLSFDSEIITSIVVSDFSSAALTSTGRLFAWGQNASGKLGDGTSIDSNIPIEITNSFVLNAGETITELTFGGNFGAAITSEGRLFTWGSDMQGGLGNGPILTANVPLPTVIDSTVFGGEAITDISTGYCHTEAVSSSGKLYTWGCNSYGQLGDGTLTFNPTPTEIPLSSFAEESIVSVHAGLYYSFAITASGNTYGWGENVNGQVGDGTMINKNAPVILSSIADTINISTIRAGRWSTLAITDSGELFRWGRASTGPIGNEANIRDVVPIQTFMMNSIESIYVPTENEFYNDTILLSVFPTYDIGNQIYSMTINGVEYLSDDLTIYNGRISVSIDNTGVIDDRFNIIINSISFVEGVDLPVIGSVTDDTILHDFAAPSIGIIDSQRIEVGQPAFDWTIVMDDVVDNSDTAIVLEVTEDNVVYDTLGTYTVTVKASDASMNETSQTFDVEVVDTTAPIINTQPTNIVIECDGNGNNDAIQNRLNNNAGATASDNCGNVTWTNNFTALSDGCGNTGSASVTFTATDGCGNASTT